MEHNQSGLVIISPTPAVGLVVAANNSYYRGHPDIHNWLAGVHQQQQPHSGHNSQSRKVGEMKERKFFVVPRLGIEVVTISYPTLGWLSSFREIHNGESSSDSSREFIDEANSNYHFNFIAATCANVHFLFLVQVKFGTLKFPHKFNSHAITI